MKFYIYIENRMVAEGGVLVREEIKRKAYFSLAEGVED